ncbi:MAG: hypothetical protein OEY79_03040 [Anaplasmataceae bacterium]|nr:hypothetical protein [Anaplasmataceae bacterium]
MTSLNKISIFNIHSYIYDKLTSSHCLILLFSIIAISLDIFSISDVYAAEKIDVSNLLYHMRCGVQGYIGPVLSFVLVFVIMSLAYKVVMSGGGRPQDGSQGLSVSTLLTIGVALAILMLAENFSSTIMQSIVTPSNKPNIENIFRECS